MRSVPYVIFDDFARLGKILGDMLQKLHTTITFYISPSLAVNQ